MNQIVAEAIILARTNFGEADRILTLLTPDHGKLRLMAKGVRREKSKLAGGIELFSVSTVTWVKGRGDIGTLISTRLVKHYSRIIEDLDRTMFGYELIKQLHKVTEDHPESEYFALLRQAFEALDDPAVPLELILLWFSAQLLRFAGHAPNLQTDAAGQKLDAGQAYNFDFEQMCFTSAPRGKFAASHIKFLRIAFTGHPAKTLAQIQGGAALSAGLAPLLSTMLQTHLSIK